MLNYFHVVLCTCRHCGWFRVVGYTGVFDGVRALIRLRPSASRVNLVEADILTGPADLPLDELTGGRSGFHDLVAEAAALGLLAAARRFDSLVAHHGCPRCKRPGGPYIIWLGWPDLDLERHRSRRLLR